MLKWMKHTRCKQNVFFVHWRNGFEFFLIQRDQLLFCERMENAQKKGSREPINYWLMVINRKEVRKNSGECKGGKKRSRKRNCDESLKANLTFLLVCVFNQVAEHSTRTAPQKSHRQIGHMLWDHVLFHQIHYNLGEIMFFKGCEFRIATLLTISLLLMLQTKRSRFQSWFFSFI